MTPLCAIEVLAVNQARVPDDIMMSAERAASRIFSAIGIKVDWTIVAPQSEEPFWQREGQVKINIVTDWHLKGMGRTLGIAERSQNHRDMLAYVFYRRIQDHASLLSSDVGAVLGYVLSHEIGHLLLRENDTSHSSTGIMRDGTRWMIERNSNDRKYSSIRSGDRQSPIVARFRDDGRSTMDDQNVNRKPNCPVLVDPTLVIWPKLDCTMFVTGLLYCRQLNTLNDSKRT